MDIFPIAIREEGARYFLEYRCMNCGHSHDMDIVFIKSLSMKLEDTDGMSE